MHEITVITPTILGRETFLLECIESVENQTHPVKRHSVLLDSTKQGPSVARNALLETVETNWVLFLDDDDLLDEDFVENCYPHLDDNDVVYTWCRKNFDYPLDIAFDADELRRRNIIPVTTLVRTELLRRVGGFGPGPYEDWHLWLKLLDRGAKFHCTCETKWSYRRSMDGQWSKDAGQ